MRSALPSESLGDLRGILWHSCADSGTLEGEPFIVLKRNVPTRTIYDVKELPPVTVAAAYSDLSDDTAEHVYGSIRRWMSRYGYRIDGPKHEIYLDQMLEIQFPLQANSYEEPGPNPRHFLSRRP